MYLIVKRIFDVFFSLLLIIILLPLFLLLAIVIFLQDGGKPIFKQIRVGQNGNKFMFYKFRSMPLKTPNVESCDKEKLKITPFGKWIRRTSLDEITQFFNVLKGDMSFIGPRPPIPTQVNLIELRKENNSIILKPGLSGWAQVNSFNNMSDLEKARYDGEYAQKISLKMDFLIFLKTITYFTKKPPTY